MAMGLKGEVWSGSQWNNEALGVGEVTQGESKEGGGDPKEQKHLKVMQGKRHSCNGRERRGRTKSRVRCLSRYGTRRQMMQRVKTETDQKTSVGFCSRTCASAVLLGG